MAQINVTPVIIDADPGIDDAVAIAMALFSPELDVRLLTSVSGVAGVDKTTLNLLKLETYLNKHVPVAAGSFAPLLQPPVEATDVHGESGMDGWYFPEPTPDLLLADGAVDAMYKTIRRSTEPVTIIALGPLTNIALMLKVHPDVAGMVGHIVLAGGSLGGGNLGPYSEFNVGSDPEAMQIVLDMSQALGFPITMIPLEIGQKAIISREEMRRACRYTITGKMLSALYDRYHPVSYDGVPRNGSEMYGPAALALLLYPQIFLCRNASVEVELSGIQTLGATCVDFGGERTGEDPFVQVACDVDSEAFVHWFTAALERCM